jgi:phage terminase large subunit GpA-like protein
MINSPFPHALLAADIYAAAAAALRPPELLRPSQFAARYRELKPGTTERPGRWSNEHFPFLTDVMDGIREALVTGKRGVVMMKAAQLGGSEAVINVLLWLMVNYPGPMLYLISKDELAKEFSRDRFQFGMEHCAPVASKLLRGRAHGEQVLIKRLIDGKFVIHGGRSVLNVESVPYRFVIIDEIDSLQETIENKGDLITMAEQRCGSFSGQTLIIVFAHPTSKERGAGKLYYNDSDQRRGHVTCCHCGAEFWLQRAHVRAIAEEGMNQLQADRDPGCYHYFAPCCGAEISDSQRYLMARNVTQKTTLPADVAARKPWLGMHLSHFYMPNKPLKILVERWIKGLDDESVKQTIINREDGDVYEVAVQTSTADDWRRLILIPRQTNDPECHYSGTVPPAVQFLTAGQDSRTTELHYAVWGWGYRRVSGTGFQPVKENHGQDARATDSRTIRCGWLIEYGVFKRQYSAVLTESDMHVFDDKLFNRQFVTADGARIFQVAQCGLDTGWQPEAVQSYCRNWPGRAVPTKGGAAGEDADDYETAREIIKWTTPQGYKFQPGEVIRDYGASPVLLNTYMLKVEWFNLVATRIRIPDYPLPLPVLVLPLDTGDDFLIQSSNEEMRVRNRGARAVHYWHKKGDNHWLDCNIYAFAMAKNLTPLQPMLPWDELQPVASAAGNNVPREHARPVRRKY